MKLRTVLKFTHNILRLEAVSFIVVGPKPNLSPLPLVWFIGFVVSRSKVGFNRTFKFICITEIRTRVRWLNLEIQLIFFDMQNLELTYCTSKREEEHNC